MDNEKDTEFAAALAGFRQKIDAIDDKLIELFKERIGIVSQVGEMKRRASPGQCPLRPGREAEMIRRIAGKFEGSKFSPAAGAAMWRLLIGASTAVEGSLALSVFAPDKDHDLYWLAREYFGGFLPATKQPLAKRVIGDVMDGKAAIGILPMLRGSDTTHWWDILLQSGKNAPKIFAHIPFVHYGRPASDAPMGLAIAKINPEPTGNDVSLLVLETNHNVSQNKLQSVFADAKLEARWIHIATLGGSANRHHLIELSGFITPEDAQLKKPLSNLKDTIKNVTFLGAYAVPMILNHTEDKLNAPREA